MNKKNKKKIIMKNIIIISLIIFTNFNITKNMNTNIDNYVDDIPFDTYEIYKKYQDSTENKNIYQYKDEDYIDDIPFDTYKIFINNKK